MVGAMVGAATGVPASYVCEVNILNINNNSVRKEYLHQYINMIPCNSYYRRSKMVDKVLQECRPDRRRFLL